MKTKTKLELNASPVKNCFRLAQLQKKMWKTIMWQTQDRKGDSKKCEIGKVRLTI